MICILEDDDNIREIENFALKNCGFVTEPAASAKEFWEIMEHKIPQLILLDIMLPDEDGISILTKLKKNPEWKKVPVILVTAKTSEMDKVKGLDTGADDYISKPFGVLELISRVKAVLRRSDSAGDDTVITNGSIELNVEKHVVSYDGNNIELTYKEFELLRVLMKNAGNVMTREILMDRVWGTSYEGESRTLDMHIKTLRKKLGEDGGKLIKTVRNVGYKFQS
ncbi:response regulator receiver domain protein [Clostridium sp. CAG:167]|nr:response regulator receiver domain protein [Clostridium sp. CAG:167]